MNPQVFDIWTWVKESDLSLTSSVIKELDHKNLLILTASQKRIPHDNGKLSENILPLSHAVM